MKILTSAVIGLLLIFPLNNSLAGGLDYESKAAIAEIEAMSMRDLQRAISELRKIATDNNLSDWTYHSLKNDYEIALLYVFKAKHLFRTIKYFFQRLESFERQNVPFRLELSGRKISKRQWKDALCFMLDADQFLIDEAEIILQDFVDSYPASIVRQLKYVHKTQRLIKIVTKHMDATRSSYDCRRYSNKRDERRLKEWSLTCYMTFYSKCINACVQRYGNPLAECQTKYCISGHQGLIYALRCLGEWD